MYVIFVIIVVLLLPCDGREDGLKKPSACERAAANSWTLGAFVPKCMPDGTFERKQCHSSTGYCWCVDPTSGNEITEPSKTINDVMTCDVTVTCVSCKEGGSTLKGVVKKDLVVRYTINNIDFVLLTVEHKKSFIYISTHNVNVDKVYDKRLSVPRNVTIHGRTTTIDITLRMLSLDDNNVAFSYVYLDKHFQMFTGENVVAVKDVPGTKTNPGVSCKVLKENNKELKSGMYWIKLENATEMYCDMDTGGGGWTLIGQANQTNETTPQVYWYNLISDDPRRLREVAENRFLLSGRGLYALKQHINFKQIRLYCNKKWHGRSIHIYSTNNTLGNKVVDYMMDKVMWEERPPSCDSFGTFSDDNSHIQHCKLWDNKKWHGGNYNARMYDIPMFIAWKFYFFLGSYREAINCDDNGDEINFSPIGEFKFYVK